LEIRNRQDTIVCAKSPSIKLSADVTIGIPPYNYLWNTGETTRTKNAVITKDTFFWVTISDSGGCTNSHTIDITFLNPPPPQPANLVYKCAGYGTQINSDIGSKVVWTAILGNKTIPNYADSTPLTVKDTGIYIATAVNSAICPGVDTFIVKNVPATAGYTKDTTICPGKSTYLNLPQYNQAWIDSGTNNWIYLGGSVNLVFLRNPAINKVYKLRFLMTFAPNPNPQYVSCTDTAYLNVHVNPPSSIKIKVPLPELCVYDLPLDLSKYSNPVDSFGT